MGRGTSRRWMLIEKLFERGSGDRLGRIPSYLPSLKGLDFCWESGCTQDSDSLSLAEAVGPPPLH